MRHSKKEQETHVFGYVTIDEDNLKVKDDRRYKGYYCGLCRDLRESFGMKGQMTLTYDMTFLAILLTGVYETPVREEKHFCPLHPGARKLCLRNACTQYAADINLMIAYYNLLDDWEDERKKSAWAASTMLKRSVRKVEEKYPRQMEAIQKYLKELHRVEQENIQDPDLAAKLTGELFAVLFTPYEDEWQEELGAIGYYIGEFIYLMDAYDDVDRDREKGNYNPFAALREKENFEETAEMILTMMMAGAAKAFEKLPILEEVDILRNIIYTGIWNKFGMTRQKRLDENQSATLGVKQ